MERLAELAFTQLVLACVYEWRFGLVLGWERNKAYYPSIVFVSQSIWGKEEK